MAHGKIDALPDASLMKRVAEGDSIAFRQLANRHLDRAHNIALRVLHNREDAEEAVQDAMAKVWRKAPTFDPERSAFSTWFYRILTNAALDKLRRRPPPADDIDLMGDTLADLVETGEDAWARQGEARRIRDAIARLPPQQRVAVVLCYYEDFTQPEAASIMDIHLKALEGLLFRAKSSLRRSIAHD